jgi:hypothetical protein
VNLFQFFNMWFIGINPLFIFLQSVKLIFKWTLKYKACQSQKGRWENMWSSVQCISYFLILSHLLSLEVTSTRIQL